MKKFLLLMITLVISVTAWAADPYFEVTSGSFASGNVTVKMTFPEATTVSVTGSIFLDHPNKPNDLLITVSPSDVIVENNTATATFVFIPWEDMIETGYLFWSAGITATGYSKYQDIYAKKIPPYATVSEGDLTIGGNVVVDVTFPEFTSASAYPASWKNATLSYDGVEVATCAMNNITNSDKTLHIPFYMTSSPGNDLSLYSVNLPFGYVQNNGVDVYEEYNVSFKTSPSVDPDDPDEGGGEGGDDPDTDPEVPADLTNYFWVENLSEDATTLSFYGKNIEYTNTPNDASSWVRMDGQIDFEAHQKVYLRASAEGNTNMANAMSVGNFGDFYDGIEWTHIDTRVAHKVGGDITTLLNAQGNMTRLPAPFTNGEYYISGVFENFFYNDTYLQDVSELVLPSTTLTEYCYAGMFNGCTSITKAPVLPATVLVKGCYDKMFNECNSLNYVEAYFSEWPKKSTGYSPYAATENWLQNVAAEGTFKTHYWVGNDYKYYGSTYPAAWNKEELGSMDIPVSAVGYTTFYYEKNWVMPEGIEGYVAYETYNNETYSYDFVFEKAFEAGEIVSFAQPLILKAKAGTYTIHFTEEDATRHISDEFFNLNGSITTKNLASEYESYNYYYYALSLNASGENVGFYWMNDNGEGFTSAPFKAWLRISKTHFASGVKGSFAFGDFEDMTDGIKTAAVSQQKAKGVYDLSGRRVNGNAQRGMYIINGKKVIR